MKKVGKLTEAHMVKPPEPKFHALVSDNLFEAKVKIKKISKKLKEDDLDLPMNKTPEASKMTTNSPKRASPKNVQVGGPYDLTAEATDDWIQGAEDDIERRGTKGKCTPITKKGCTGKAKALAKTFKKMAKKRDDSIKTKNEGSGGDARLQRVGDALAKKGGNDPNNPLHKRTLDVEKKVKLKADDALKRIRARQTTTEATTPKPLRQTRARAQAGKPLKKGTAKMVANDPKQDLATAVTAAGKLN
tara:strand:- start:3310 stop:4047 length:738 start_codon:yes stop_codon:yes gene_type:complete